MSTPNRIEKSIVIQAPVSRVWNALTEHVEFGEWFKARFEKPFVPGQTVAAQIDMPDHPQYDKLPFKIWVEVVEPQTRFAFRWHPYAVERDVDYSVELPTLVEFTLTDSPEGVRLTVVETGFSQLPLLRQAKAFESNSSGWAQQLENIARYVVTTST